MLNSFLISSGVLPLIMFATVLQPTSLSRILVVFRVHCTRYRQEWFDVEVVCSQNDLKEHLLIYCNELLIPLADVGGALASFIL